MTRARITAAALAATMAAYPASALGPLSPAAAQTAAARQVEKTDLAFAQSVAQIGIGPGFRRFAGPGAVMFTPDPSPAGPYLQTVRTVAALLWRPQYVGVAPSGDLAFSRGPSLFQGAGRSSGGFYLTIWKRGADGSWRFALDHGVDMRTSIFEEPAVPAYLMTIDAPSGPDPNEGLREADAALDSELSNGPSKAFAARLDEQAIVVRTNRAVAVGRRRALRLINDTPPIVEAQLLNGGVSADGILGYAYGKARWMAAGAVQQGYYVRVWRSTAQGWRLVVDHLAER